MARVWCLLWSAAAATTACGRILAGIIILFASTQKKRERGRRKIAVYDSATLFLLLPIYYTAVSVVLKGEKQKRRGERDLTTKLLLPFFLHFVPLWLFYTVLCWKKSFPFYGQKHCQCWELLFSFSLSSCWLQNAHTDKQTDRHRVGLKLSWQS